MSPACSGIASCSREQREARTCVPLRAFVVTRGDFPASQNSSIIGLIPALLAKEASFIGAVMIPVFLLDPPLPLDWSTQKHTDDQ